MIAAMLVVNAAYPAIVRSSNSIVNVSERMEDRIGSQVSIVYATGELDDNGVWQDTDSDTFFDVTVWVKNVGSTRILGIDQMDVFLGKLGNFSDFARIPHVDDAGGGYPSWSYTIENGTEWENTVTVKIAVHYSSALTSDTYRVKVITPSGAYDENDFSF
jgi:archaellum component FlaG (FlaF/FlaG flagellin family)